jgi:hypothetical protein
MGEGLRAHLHLNMEVLNINVLVALNAYDRFRLCQDFKDGGIELKRKASDGMAPAITVRNLPSIGHRQNSLIGTLC